MKPKEFCQECGRLLCKKKLKKSPIDKRLLCANCFKRIAGIKLDEEPEIKKPSNLSDKKKKAIRMAKNRARSNYLFKNEGEYLKSKYGNKYNKQIKRLMKALGKTRFNILMKENSKLDKEKMKIKINERFLDNLK